MTLDVDGILDQPPMVLAVNRRPRPAGVRPNLIVVHTAESGETGSAAEGIANYFASGATIGSAHICVDDNSTVRCATDLERTNGAAGANDDGLHVEIAGRASQTPGDWADTYSLAALERAAQVVAAWCHRWAIEPRKLDPAAVRAGARGICGHHDVSQAYGLSHHWDPGPSFPWGPFIDRVRQLLTDPGEIDVTPEQLEQIVRKAIREETPGAVRRPIREEVTTIISDFRDWLLRRGPRDRAPFRWLLKDTSETGAAQAIKDELLSDAGKAALKAQD